MIGGENMYMPLCRECHARETRLNADNLYAGDPSKISVEIENKQFEASKTPGAALKESDACTPASSLTGTT